MKYPPVEIGKKYGRWAVVGAPYLGPQSSGSGINCTWWPCKCECGTEQDVRQINLKNGTSKGCAYCGPRGPKSWEIDCSPEQKRRLVTRVHNAIARCTDPSRDTFQHYGGRGITVYPEWLENPGKFAAYLMTLPGWDDLKLTLDREDNEGNYEPGNLRFITNLEQANNRRARQNLVPVTFFYEPKVILVSRPKIDWDNVETLLFEGYDEDGGVVSGAERDLSAAWTVDPRTTDAEAICELFGRGCYASFGEAQGRLGPNYIEHLLEAGHGSVLENASFGFVILQGSRGLMAQMTRHRAGFAWAIESTHFRDYSLGARASLAGLPDDPELRRHAENTVIASVTGYARAWAMAQSHTVKKKTTAAAVRGLLPTALESRMGMTANLRALRHVIELRGAEDNVPEIRMVSVQLLDIMKKEAPAVFYDFESSTGADGWPVTTCKHKKV